MTSSETYFLLVSGNREPVVKVNELVVQTIFQSAVTDNLHGSPEGSNMLPRRVKAHRSDLAQQPTAYKPLVNLARDSAQNCKALVLVLAER